MRVRVATLVWLVTVLSITGWSVQSAAPSSDPPKSAEEKARALTANLRSESYEEREAAQTALLALSVEHVPELKRILSEEKDHEAITRLKRVIQRLSPPALAYRSGQGAADCA